MVFKNNLLNNKNKKKKINGEMSLIKFPQYIYLFRSTVKYSKEQIPCKTIGIYNGFFYNSSIK